MLQKTAKATSSLWLLPATSSLLWVPVFSVKTIKHIAFSNMVHMLQSAKKAVVSLGLLPTSSKLLWVPLILKLGARCKIRMFFFHILIHVHHDPQTKLMQIV